MSKLSVLYQNPAIAIFGGSLRLSLRPPKKYERLNLPQDYASLVEFEYVQDQKTMALALENFLRRFDSLVRRIERETGEIIFRPSEENLREVIRLCESHPVDVVSAAIISHALAFPSKKEEAS